MLSGSVPMTGTDSPQCAFLDFVVSLHTLLFFFMYDVSLFLQQLWLCVFRGRTALCIGCLYPLFFSLVLCLSIAACSFFFSLPQLYSI